MPRPRLDESTIEALTLLANEYTEFDAANFEIDTRCRLVVNKLAGVKIEDEIAPSDEVKEAQELTQPFDL